MRRDNLAVLGSMLYGPKFLRRLAEGLTDVGPKQVHESHLSAWIKGDRPVPAWVAPQARALLPRGLNSLVEQVKNLTRAATTPDFFEADGAEFDEGADFDDLVRRLTETLKDDIRMDVREEVLAELKAKT